MRVSAVTMGILIGAMALLGCRSAAAGSPRIVTKIGGVEVTTSLGADELNVGGSMSLHVTIKPTGTNPAPTAVRARLGMPDHGHWVTDEARKPFAGEALEFAGSYPMPGRYRFRVWLEFEDGENNTAIDFMLPGAPLEPVRVAPMPSANGKERERLAQGPVDFELPDLLTNELRSLASLRGEPVWLSFWASWCGPCRVELPEVEKLADTWSGHGARVLTVSLDRDAASAKRMLTSLGLELDSVIDTDGETLALFDASRLPLNVLLNPDGSIATREEGYRGDFLEHANSALRAATR